MRAEPGKEKRRLLPMIHDGRRPLVLALGHEFGKQFLHGVLSVVNLAATRAGKSAEHRPVAAVEHGCCIEGG